MAKIQNLSFFVISLLVSGCNYTALTCSETKFSESLKTCSEYKCSRPLMGPSFYVTPLNNSLCKASIGFHKEKEFMSCQAATKEFAPTRSIIKKWSSSNVEVQATYDIKNLDIEYFINNHSIGKLFSGLVNQNKCKYEKSP